MAIDDPLYREPASLLAMLLRDREISARELVEAHLRRIEAWNPAVNAIVTLTPERALAQADAADAHLTAGGEPGLLHGLPVVHKDLFATNGIRTTRGSPIFAGWLPDYDERHIQRMASAGAIMLGKSNTPEFGAGSQTFNRVFGATRNPYDLSRTCGGSSGGSAVALATGMAALADGSDVGGSLRNPASFSGVVGLRPSPGRVPGKPGWPRLEVSGPMGRTVGDVALLLDAIAGPWPGSPLALERPPSLFSHSLERDFAGARIAWSPRLGGLPVETEVLDALSAVPALFEAIGCRVEGDSPDLSGAEEIFYVLRALMYERELGAIYDAHASSMKDTVRWNVEAGRALTGPRVAAAEGAHGRLLDRVGAFFERFDFLVCPTVQVLPFSVDIPYPESIGGIPMTNYVDWMRSCTDISVTACPALSLPAGLSTGGLPVGLQIVGRHRDDLGVLQLGRAFEQARGPFTPPPEPAAG